MPEELGAHSGPMQHELEEPDLNPAPTVKPVLVPLPSPEKVSVENFVTCLQHTLSPNLQNEAYFA